MKNNVLRSVNLFIFIMLTGCSSLSEKHFPLSSLTSDAQTHVAQQQWQINQGNEHFSLQVIVERTPERWQLIMMNNLGQRFATALITGDHVTVEQLQSHPANKLIPELLDAVQFSFWPLADLQKPTVSDWRFTDDAKHRDIYFSGILRATVDYTNENLWQGNLVYTTKKTKFNKKSNFQLLIESQLLN